MGNVEPHMQEWTANNPTISSLGRSFFLGNASRLGRQTGPEGILSSRSRMAPGLSGRLHIPLDQEDLIAARMVEAARVAPLRQFDQISMLPIDLARQVKLVRSLLAGKSVVFMGDNDGASLMFGLMEHRWQAPKHMLLLDFDKRILVRAQEFARRHGFSDRLSTRAYNVFDPVPADLLGQFDAFYTNPPYGRSNNGQSVRLFVGRGMELCQRHGNACGCVILPDDIERSWTRLVMRTTQAFVIEQGWQIQYKVDCLHRYNLPTDPHLKSGMLWITDALASQDVPSDPYAGRHVPANEISHFYGTKVSPPYPHYVEENGEYDWNWKEISQ